MSQFSIKTVAIATVVGGAIVGAMTASAALNLPTMSCSYMFNTNMRQGSRSTDVMNLQKVLNMYPQTRVAESGAGSPGMETSTFGPATRAAVNKFQALHLAELGISAPTGNVFAGTRGLLNAVCTGTGTPGTGTGTVSGPVSVMLSASQPMGMVVAGQAGARLADITFMGNGTVTSLELQRIGVSADATLNNVYLYDGAKRITDAASVITGGYIRFNAASGLFTVNGTRTITVRADIASGTSGQSVGVKVNSVTPMGGSASTFTNMMGNSLQIASVTTATVNFNSMDTTARTVDAGTTNFNVWSGTASVGTRDVMLKAATFKFVGSAPADSVTNLSLFVDGAKVAGPTMVDASNNNKVTFDLTANPVLLRTGSRTIDVRGDIVKGSNRTATFSVENVADLMFEDRDLNGVNVSATVASSALTNGNSAYGTITINRGSVTVNVDPAFVANKVTGGATNMTIGQFVLRAYGEDVKVNTLAVNPDITSGTPGNDQLQNVGLFLNGGQIGSSQNYSTTSLTYNLGSSLIIPAGQSVTLAVKADIKNAAGTSYTAGTISVAIGGSSNNAQGQSSNELISVAGSAVTGNALTVSSGTGSFARTAGFTAKTVAPNSTMVKIGSFTLQAGSAEDVIVNGATVHLNVTTFALTNVTNLSLKDGSTTLGTPIGSVTASNTISFADIYVPMNATRTFDVYADLGGATSGNVRTDMTLSTRGPVSGTTAQSFALGVATTPTVATLATSTLVSSSPVAQFVVGSSQMNIATWNLKTVAGDATVRELRFAVTGTDSIETVTVNGVTAAVVSGSATLTGLSIPVTTTGTDVAATVKYSGFKNSTAGGSLEAGVATVKLTLDNVEAISGNGNVITQGVDVDSNTMSLVASKPVVTMSSGNTDTLVLGAENKIGEFTVAADANGKISVATTTINLSAVGITGPQFASLRLADGNTTIASAPVTGSSTAVIHFGPNYEVSAGQSKVFSLFGTVTGAAQASITPYVTANFASSTGFQWRDVIGGNTQYAGTNIYNFPTNSYSTKR